jgi:hypothetical protein
MDNKVERAYLEWDEARRMLTLADELKNLAIRNEQIARENYYLLVTGTKHPHSSYPRAVDEYREWVSGRLDA